MLRKSDKSNSYDVHAITCVSVDGDNGQNKYYMMDAKFSQELLNIIDKVANVNSMRWMWQI